ncbi:MAG: hypothetical protein V2B20_19500 [Pseudomonadota bacterium]
MNKFLLIVTDGADSQISGIQYLLNSLWVNAASGSAGWSVHILTPERVTAESLPQGAFPDAHIRSFPLGKYVDKYYIKFLLPKFIAAHCHERDLILYLDYDHICWSDFQLPPLAENTIYLSSEIHALETILTQSALESAFLLDRLSLHYNTSLIYTTAGVLMQMADQWAGCYSELSAYISSRYLEEVSFSCAALQCHIVLKPIQAKIQSNWANIHQDAGLFHYGGEHKYSGVIKGFLAANGISKWCSGNDAPGICQEMEIFEKICAAFVEYQPAG